MSKENKNNTNNKKESNVKQVDIAKVAQKDALHHSADLKQMNHGFKFHKTIFIPVFIMLMTVGMGALVIFTAFKTSNTETSNTMPEDSYAGVCVTDVIEIKDQKYLTCADNTCVETTEKTDLTCSDVGSINGCFGCENFVASVSEGVAPLEVSFESSVKSQKPVSYAFDFGDKSDTLETEDNTNITHTYAEPGNYTAKLRVVSTNSDNQPIEDYCETQVNVLAEKPPEKPVECLGLTVTPESGEIPLKATFTANGTGEDPLTYRYVFGDGQEITTANPTIDHVYNETGVYTAKVFVISNKKESPETDACVVTIDVKDINIPTEIANAENPNDQTVENTEEAQGAPVTHLECVNQTCQPIEGLGENLCSIDADCKKQTRLVCKNQACVEVYGQGENECQVNDDCIVTTVTTQDEKPVVPETGIEDQMYLYIILSIVLIMIGGITFKMGKEK